MKCQKVEVKRSGGQVHYVMHCVIVNAHCVTFSALMLLVWRQEGHRVVKWVRQMTTSLSQNFVVNGHRMSQIFGMEVRESRGILFLRGSGNPVQGRASGL